MQALLEIIVCKFGGDPAICLLEEAICAKVYRLTHGRTTDAAPLMMHYTAHKVGVRMTERYQMLGQVGHYRFSVSVFGRKSRFTFGGTYGFGRMCYVTFGLPSVSADL